MWDALAFYGNEKFCKYSFTKFNSVTFNFEESKLVRFFTCVCICDSFALKFAHYLLDHIFDVHRHMKIKKL